MVLSWALSGKNSHELCVHVYNVHSERHQKGEGHWQRTNRRFGCKVGGTYKTQSGCNDKCKRMTPSNISAKVLLTILCRRKPRFTSYFYHSFVHSCSTYIAWLTSLCLFYCCSTLSFAGSSSLAPHGKHPTNIPRKWHWIPLFNTPEIVSYTLCGAEKTLKHDEWRKNALDRSKTSKRFLLCSSRQVSQTMLSTIPARQQTEPFSDCPRIR